MEKVATTFRIDPTVKEGLAKLSRLQRRSLNHLANEAIAEFVARGIRKTENELQDTLAELRAYRLRDPNFERAIDEIVEAEATAKEDPAEGEVTGKSGRTESMVLGLLNE